MNKGPLSDREQAMEANYFRQQDALLIEKLRQQASLDEIASAVADKLKVDNPDLLTRVRHPRNGIGFPPGAAGSGCLGRGFRQS